MMYLCLTFFPSFVFFFSIAKLASSTFAAITRSRADSAMYKSDSVASQLPFILVMREKFVLQVGRDYTMKERCRKKENCLFKAHAFNVLRD